MMVKQLVASDKVLVHYDPALPIRLACDASPYGLGAVLSHITADGVERPIAFVSRTLTTTERNYAQIDKEALGLYWATKKFFSYLYGRHFTLVTDHQPLVSIFHPTKAFPAMTAARLQRYAMFLAGLDYTIEFRESRRHGNADALSRLPLSTRDTNEPDAADVFTLTQMEILPVTHAIISRALQRDPLLSRVYQLTSTGWNIPPKTLELAPFYSRRNELTIHQGCLLWGGRVIVPQKLRQQILDQLHEAHSGVVKMKSLARSYVWWPGIDAEIENITKACQGCMNIQKEPVKVPLHPWEYPSRPWQRVHIDYCGPLWGYMLFVMVDAHSKWPEVVCTRSTTSERTIEIVREIFSRNGICEQLVSDNAPQFTSEEFGAFTAINGILHIKSAPYHPATNGLAERFVQTLKNALKAAQTDPGTLKKKLAQFLLTYRNTLHATTNETPARLFMGRALRTKLDLLKPNMEDQVQRKQLRAMMDYHSGRFREFEEGQTVVVRDYRAGGKWTPGTIKKRTGQLTYEVMTDNTTIPMTWRRHVDQIRAAQPVGSDRTAQPAAITTIPPEMITWGATTSTATDERFVETPNLPASSAGGGCTIQSETGTVMQESDSTGKTSSETVGERRYPYRFRKAPERLDL